MNTIYEEVIGSSLLHANWQQLQTILQKAITSQENIATLASKILTRIQDMPESTRLRACRSLLTELMDKPDSLAVLNAHIEDYRTAAKKALEKLGYDRDLKWLPYLLDLILLTESDPKEPIRNLISSLEHSGTDPYLLDFSKRILSHIEALEQMGRQAIHKLDPIKILQISIIADTMLQKNITGYVKKTEIGSTYSLTVDPANRKITILLKGKEGCGPIRAAGGCAKVYSVIEMSPKGTLHAVQKVNKDTNVPISERELKYEQMFGSLRGACSYKKLVNGVLIDKISMIKEAFDSDLGVRMKQKPFLTQDEKINILISVAKNLQYIHSKGVMHNDMKILNVLWKKEKCEICDFGLSFEPSHMPSPSVYKGTYGTPEFSAPEMLKIQDLAPSFTQDIYAFGAIAYHLVQGKHIPWQEYITAAVRGVDNPPIPSSAAKAQALKMQQHIAVVINRLQQKKDSQGLAKEECLDLAIHRLLDPNPQGRISLADFVSELEQIKQRTD